MFKKGDWVMHGNRGGVYRVMMTPDEGLIIESTRAPAYVLKGKPGQLWAKPASEVEDGRFVFVHSK